MRKEPAMSKRAQAGQGRRRFLANLGRLTALGAVGAVAGKLARGPVAPEQECTGTGACRECPVRPTCRLPQGRLARQAFDEAKSP
jgi:hypothetical protein